MKTPKDAMPWVGLYVAGASLACTPAMAADTFQGFQQRKLWFHRTIFVLLLFYSTLFAISNEAKSVYNYQNMSNCMMQNGMVWMLDSFSCLTMLANFLPSLGLMDDKELLVKHRCGMVVSLGHRLPSGDTSFLGLLVLRLLRLLGLLVASFSHFTYAIRSFLILFSYCWYFCKLLIRFKKEVNVSNSNVRSEMKEYARYVLQIEDDAKLSERITRNALKSINQLLSMSEKNEPGNLIKLLKKSKGFKGVLEFDNDQVPPLHSEETKNSWSLVVVTLTAIVIALPNTADDHGKGLIASLREGIQIVRNIEECLDANSDLVKIRKAARRVSYEILEWLRDEAVKIVIQFKSCKRRRMDDSHYKFIVASSMYRVSQTILIHCNVDSMADIGKWHALPKSEIPNDAPLNQIQLAFPSPNESVIYTFSSQGSMERENVHPNNITGERQQDQINDTHAGDNGEGWNTAATKVLYGRSLLNMEESWTTLETYATERKDKIIVDEDGFIAVYGEWINTQEASLMMVVYVSHDAISRIVSLWDSAQYISCFLPATIFHRAWWTLMRYSFEAERLGSTLSVEALHVTLQEAKFKNVFEGVKVGCNGVDISHLQFVDDALILEKWSLDNAKSLCNS
ncbi:hypothetical protein Tco_0526867 [Tanacetum coccineum]